MLSINDIVPEFNLMGAHRQSVRPYTHNELKGKWTILFFYPEDFSFICPTEVTGFNEEMDKITTLDAQILGISVDPIELHTEWIKELGIEYPLLSDPNGVLVDQFGVRDPADGRAHRATFIVDPTLKIEFAMVTSRNVGRSVAETLRVLAAIRSGELCPADYSPLEV